MSGAIAHQQAARLRGVLERVFDELDGSEESTQAARAAFLRLVDVLETSEAATVFPTDSLLSTQQAAALLGVSRMTVVRLVDHGEIPVQGTGTHRKIRAGDLARYRAEASARRRAALHGLAADSQDTPGPDVVVATR